MPSPVGHALAGLAVSLAGRRQAEPRPILQVLRNPLTLAAVALATLPDADLLLPGFHRTVTHSVATTLAVIILAIAVTAWVTGRRAARDSRLDSTLDGRSPLAAPRSRFGPIAWGVVLTCAAAHASHLLLDWLGADRSQPAGIQAFWPWSDRWYISGWDLFPQIERRDILSARSMAINLRALMWEVLLMGPVAAATWWRGARGGVEGRR